jgi:hypothetical protein
MLSALALLFLSALSAAAPTGKAPETPQQQANDQIQITSVATSGNGCPAGTFTTQISPDRTVLTLGFDKYLTTIGNHANFASRDRDCQILLNVRYPLGCTESVLEATYHGFAQLDKGIAGAVAANYILLDGIVANANSQTSFESSQWSEGGVYTKHDVVPTSKNIRSQAERNTNVLIRTRIDLFSFNATATASLSGDDATIAFTQQQRCK